MNVEEFNRKYEGFYPALHNGLYRETGSQNHFLAGIDKDGYPHLFWSLTGSEWEEKKLLIRSNFGRVRRPESEMIEILEEPDEGQIYLVCAAGEIVILPDCPKCITMKWVRLGQGVSIVGASLSGMLGDTSVEEGEERRLILNLSDGSRRELPLSFFRQYRVAFSFARKLQEAGAELIDVDETEDVGELLSDKDKNHCLIFLCRTGRRADEAAEYARSHGFRQAYSAGGREEWAHVE